MNILMITEKDAANASLYLIANAFQKHGHEVNVYAPFYSDNVLRDLKKLSIKIYNFAELTEEVLEKHDFIFSSVFSLKWLYDKGLFGVKKFIFTHDYLLHGEMTYGGDFSFATCIHNTASSYQQYLTYGKMGIGEPKYDSLDNSISVEGNNRILFIDSGHYPFGLEGRMELAKTLVNICRQYPEYELWIKPRFLPTDDIITHYNGLHLYEVIEKIVNGKIPDNLVMLREHKDLQELINQSRTVMCMYTTAYISASLANKGLIILEGLPNEDCYDQRNKRKLIFRDRMKSSGALVNYKKVCDVLPDGIICSKDHMDEFLVQKNHVADKIVEVVTYIYENLIQYEKFPENKNYTYQEKCSNILERKGASWETILSDRFANYLKYRILISFDYRVNAKVNIQNILSPIYEYEGKGYITYEVFKELMKEIDNIVFEGVINNSEVMMKDEIDQGILLHAYFWKKKEKELIAFPNKTTGAYNYFVGRMFFNKGNAKEGIEFFEEYIRISEQSDFIKEISDMPNNKMYALKIMTKYYLSQNQIENARKSLEIWRQFFDAMNPNVKDLKLIKDSTLSYQLTCLEWYQMEVENKLEDRIRTVFAEENIAVYGVGRVTKELIAVDAELMKRIVVFIDQFTKSKNLQDKPIVRLENQEELAAVNTILVTVAYDYERIFNDITAQHPQKKVIPIWDMLH